MPTAGAGFRSPLVRSLAASHGVDLRSLVGTGLDGRVRKQDVLAAASAQRAGPAGPAGPVTPSPGDSLPRVTVASARGEAQLLTTVVEVDLSRLGAGEIDHDEISTLAVLAHATIEAVRSYPRFNSYIDPATGDVTSRPAGQIGLAVVATSGPLAEIVDAADLNLSGLARRIRELSERAGTGTVGECAGAAAETQCGNASLTVMDLSDRVSIFDSLPVQPAQVATLGVGAPVRRTVVMSHEGRSESIAIRTVAHLCLTYDGRIVDGSEAARFLRLVKAGLEQARTTPTSS